jgi:hypothetical protein
MIGEGRLIDVREPTLRPGRLLAAVVVLWMLTTTAAAADLQPRTVAAFDRYLRATEAQMVPDPFLRIDGFSDVERRAKLAELSRGEPFVTSIPRESLAFTLETTRKTLASHR